MGILKVVQNISSIGDRVTKVFFGERRKRVRIKIDKIKDQLAEIENLSPTSRRANRYHKLEKKLKKLQDYLMEE